MDFPVITSLTALPAVLPTNQEDVLLVFDIDNTLTITDHPEVKKKISPEVLKKMKDLRQNSPEKWKLLQHLVVLSYPQVLAEKDTAKQISDWQSKGYKAITLSAALSGPIASYGKFEVSRYNSLLDLGLDFSKSFAEEITFSDIKYKDRSAQFYRGIFHCCDDSLKGAALVAFLKYKQLKPKLIIMIDDVVHNLTDVQKTLSEYDQSIDFKGFVWGNNFSGESTMGFWQPFFDKIQYASLDLPNYVQCNNPDLSQELKDVLKNPANEIKFPLSEEDIRDAQTLEHKFRSEVLCAGLAAPQIGIAKRIIVFDVSNIEYLKKFRQDIYDDQETPITVWFNPSYQPIGEEKTVDGEGCFSVLETAGYVPRYNKIQYSAQLADGSTVTGVAEGFKARVIQHEVDHINGQMFIDKASEVLNMDDYRKKRLAAAKSQG